MLIKNQSGTALVIAIVFVAVAMAIISGSVTMSAINVASGSTLYLGEEVYHMAESGIENSIVKLLRNNVGSETLTFNSGTVTINITGSGPYTVTSSASKNGIIRTVQAVLTFTNNKLDITSWKEI